MVNEARPGSTHDARAISPALVVWTVLMLSLLGTSAIWYLAHRELSTIVEERFKNESQDLVDNLRGRLEDHALGLVGGEALVRSTPDMTVEDWREFVKDISTERRHAELRSIGFARRVAAADRDAFVSRMRAVTSSSYDISPPGERAEYFPVQYREGAAPDLPGRAGYDLMSEPARRQAIERARDTGRPAMTGKVKIGSDAAGAPVGFLIFVPVYRSGAEIETVANRRAALIGVVYSPFVMSAFVDAALTRENLALAPIIYDGPAARPDAILYRPPGADADDLARTRAEFRDDDLHVAFGGNVWTVSAISAPAFTALSYRGEPNLILAVGIALSGLLTASAWWFARELNRRRLTEMQLSRRSEQRARLADLGRIALTGTASLDDLFDAVLRAIAEVADLPIVGILEITPDGKSVVMRRQRGFQDAEAGRRVEIGTASQAGFTLLSRAPVVVTDAAAETRFSITPTLLQQGVVCGITVAIHGSDRPWGVLGAHTTERRALSDDDVNFLDQIAYVLSQVISRNQQADLLRQAQKMEAVGQLTGGVAHDFNNLLTVIIGNAEDLANDPESSATVKSDADLIIKAASRGAQLTQRLLAFSRRQPLHRTAVDINDLVINMESFLRRTLGEHIEIDWRRAPDLWPSYTDKNQVENCLINLAVNARDAMPEGGKLIIETANVTLDAIYAAANEEVKSGDYVMLAVTDTGSGMSPEVASRAFDPFFTTKEVGQGSGLGLSMIYGFAKQSGGHVKIYSELGHGTAVKLYLPRSTQHVAEGEASAPAPSSDLGKGETILVVEDDAAVRAIAVRNIVDLGYKVIEAPDGPSALAALEGNSAITLVFTDVVMPGGMSGVDLLAEARARRPDLKILFTSGYPEHATRNGAALHDAEILGKPYRKAQLARKLRELLDGR